MTERVLETRGIYHRDMVMIETERAEIGDVIHVIEHRNSGLDFHTTYDVVKSQKPRFKDQWSERK